MRSGVFWVYPFGFYRLEKTEMQKDGVEVEQEMHVWFGLQFVSLVIWGTLAPPVNVPVFPRTMVSRRLSKTD